MSLDKSNYLILSILLIEKSIYKLFKEMNLDKSNNSIFWIELFDKFNYKLFK